MPNSTIILDQDSAGIDTKSIHTAPQPEP
jgi:hypothetical protein